jgi:hypothetical protein
MPPDVVGTLLSPYTPLLGFSSSSSLSSRLLIPTARLIGRTTVNAASATISVAGRTNAGVVVITAGPRVTTESGPVAVIAAPRIGVDGAEAGPGAVINRGSLCPKAVPRDDAEEPELLRVVVVVDTELVGGEWWFLEVSPRSLHC